ncbi:MAG: cytochrome c [Devosia sp.]
MAKSLTIVVITLCCAAIVVGGGAWGAAYYGLFDVAAIVPDPPLFAKAMHYVSDRAVAVRLGEIKVPDRLDKPPLIQAGAVLFAQNCVTCHGGPGLASTKVAQGLNPAPPDLFRSGRDAEPDETFWFVKNGVKMTGMPGFGPTMTDAEIWSLTAFLHQAPGLTSAQFAQQTGLAAAPTPVG